MVNKCEKNLLLNFYFRQTAILFLYFFNFIPFLLLFSSFFPTFFVLILLYLSGTCTFFFADISGRNFLSSFGHFSANLFPRWGGGGGGLHVHLPAYAPVLCIYSLQYETPLFSIHVFRMRRLVHTSSSSWLQNLNFKFEL